MAVNVENLLNRLEAVTNKLEAAILSTGTSTSGVEASLSPSVVAFDNLIKDDFMKFLDKSNQIGGEIATQANLVKDLFELERDFLKMVSQCKQPSEEILSKLLSPLATKIQAVQEFREAHRSSDFFNHLSAISESIAALGWLTVSPAPAPFIKEMSDAGQFFTNRVLKDFKEKDPLHLEWVRCWLITLTDLQLFVKEHHTTGLQWNRQGKDATVSGSQIIVPPPPPPAPAVLTVTAPASVTTETDTQRAALFSQLNRGDEVTKGLKKVTDDMKTHKNPELRATTPISIKSLSSPTTHKAPVTKPAKCALEGKKWIIEYQQNNKSVVLEETEIKQTVYIYKCENSTIQVKGKVNSITLDGCKKTALVFDDVIACVDFVNCQSVQVQVIGKVELFSIDKTDGCMVYLSKGSLNAQIVTAKSSEMNVLIPDDNGEFKEFAVPEQYKTYWNGKKLVTEVTDINN